jgi:HD superfamily phosphohydrolase
MTTGKTITFADVTETSVSFQTGIPAHSIALKLIDTKWFQRLRDISQTANTRLVYMFSEHSRFGHSIGVCNLANLLMEKLSKRYAKEIEPFAIAVSAAALLHDIGHLAPGSHTAFKTWFPDLEDSHESIATRIIAEDNEIASICNSFGTDTLTTIQKILQESDDLPPWIWEIISGGGWNVDRGNWCLVDSILAGVSYGRYNVSALTESMVISDDKHLAFEENRLDAMMHFALSRHAMYRQIYQHRVLLAADTINLALAKRARELKNELPFADQCMQEVLAARTPEELSLTTIFSMRESWWRYHLSHWQYAKDPVLADLASRLLNRKLFKTIRVHETDTGQALTKLAEETARNLGFDPAYYVHHINTSNINLSDYKQSMLVIMEDGRKRHLADAEPLFGAMAKETGSQRKSWLVIPSEVKEKMGRDR